MPADLCPTCALPICPPTEPWDLGTHCPRSLRCYSKATDTKQLAALVSERDCLRIGFDRLTNDCTFRDTCSWTKAGPLALRIYRRGLDKSQSRRPCWPTAERAFGIALNLLSARLDRLEFRVTSPDLPRSVRFFSSPWASVRKHLRVVESRGEQANV